MPQAKLKEYSLRVSTDGWCYYDEAFIRAGEDGPIAAAERVVGKILRLCAEGPAGARQKIEIDFDCREVPQRR